MATGPGPRFTFPQHMTAVKFASGDWIVVTIEVQIVNVTSYTWKLNDIDGYDTTGALEKMPFDESKGPSFKVDGLEDETQYRGNANLREEPPPPEDDSGTPPPGENDLWTSLYFQQNKRAKDDKTKEEDRQAEPIILEFPGLEKENPGKEIYYFVWPSDNGDPVVPWLPQPSKEEALGPIPEYYKNWYGPKNVWVAVYNSATSWYESWVPGLRSVMIPIVGADVFDALRPPGLGWFNAADRDAFLAAWNQVTAWSQNQDGAYQAFWPLPTYYGFEIDFTEPPPPNPGQPSRVDVEVHAYRVRRNNMIYDDNNALKFKLPTGKNHATKSFSQGKPSEKRRVRIDWNGKDGVSIRDI